MLKRTSIALALAASVATASAAQAQQLKVAISQRGFWDSSFLEFAEKEGFLKKAGLDTEFTFTQGGGQTLQVITSGSVDVAMSNGLLGTIGAYAKGAPIRVISAQMTGAHELFWYVRADSKIRSFKDADGKTVAFSSPGSSSNLILLHLLQKAGAKGAKPTATGGLPGTLTQVMTGQIDIGWATPPFALRELQEKKIVIIGRAREATELRDQTIRVNIANVQSLKTKRDAVTKLMQVYHQSIEWAYSNPKAIDYFAEFSKAPRDIAKRAVDEFFPREALQIGQISGLERTLKDALEYKFINKPMTPKDVEGLFDIVYRPK
jgi:NitT/TauT family transport system substrate-binding protein